MEMKSDIVPGLIELTATKEIVCAPQSMAGYRLYGKSLTGRTVGDGCVGE